MSDPSVNMAAMKPPHAAFVVYNRADLYARQGAGGGMVLRDDSPRYFCLVIACYAALAIALMTIF